MKCVSIRQPWADLITDGKRRIEIRTWISGYRGPILIHAGLEVDRAECRRLHVRPSATGAIIGRVELAAMVDLDHARWKKWRKHHLEQGPKPPLFLYAWLLKNPMRFREPIPYKGKLGIFEVPDGIIPLYRILKGRLIVESIVPGRYAGTKTAKIFGRLDCTFGMLIRKENRVFFHTWEDALAAGYRPCKKCNPTPHD